MAGILQNQSALADSADCSLEILLAPYLTPPSGSQARLSEEDIRQISTGLSRMGKASWSRVPRIFAVLRMIDQVHVLDAFLSQGISDIWFPFSHKTLPESLRSASARFEFLRLQDAVLTKAFDLEREDGKHRHFSRAEDIPLQKVEELGKGGFGYVDRVISTITYREYARKLIPRGKTFRKNTEVLEGFERELGHLKKMSHIHIVELIGSYTDDKFVGILMSPVADYNLKDFLMRENLTPGERSFLRTFFGCLAAALCYLHENKIRHKDIKPQNVLVKGHQVFLTDFGISLDWSELDQSTTTGLTTKTPRYCAPEVAGFLPRNSLSDMWSLGCVFLEIWTVLKRETLDALIGYLEHHGTRSTCYSLNCESSLEWCTLLERKAGHAEDNPPAVWIRGLLQPDQEARWTAQKLVNSIQHTNDRADLRFAFSGTCCDGVDGSTSSGGSSKRSSALLEETGASSVGVYYPSSGKGKQKEEPEVPAHDSSSSLTPRPLAMPSPVRRPKNAGRELAEATPSRWLLSPEQQAEQLPSGGAQPSAKTEELVQDESACAADTHGHEDGQFRLAAQNKEGQSYTIQADKIADNTTALDDLSATTLPYHLIHQDQDRVPSRPTLLQPDFSQNSIAPSATRLEGVTAPIPASLSLREGNLTATRLNAKLGEGPSRSESPRGECERVQIPESAVVEASHNGLRHEAPDRLSTPKDPNPHGIGGHKYYIGLALIHNGTDWRVEFKTILPVTMYASLAAARGDESRDRYVSRKLAQMSRRQREIVEELAQTSRQQREMVEEAVKEANEEGPGDSVWEVAGITSAPGWGVARLSSSAPVRKPEIHGWLYVILATIRPTARPLQSQTAASRRSLSTAKTDPPLDLQRHDTFANFGPSKTKLIPTTDLPKGRAGNPPSSPARGGFYPPGDDKQRNSLWLREDEGEENRDPSRSSSDPGCTDLAFDYHNEISTINAADVSRIIFSHAGSEETSPTPPLDVRTTPSPSPRVPDTSSQGSDEDSKNDRRIRRLSGGAVQINDIPSHCDREHFLKILRNLEVPLASEVGFFPGFNDSPGLGFVHIPSRRHVRDVYNRALQEEYVLSPLHKNYTFSKLRISYFTWDTVIPPAPRHGDTNSTKSKTEAGGLNQSQNPTNKMSFLSRLTDSFSHANKGFKRNKGFKLKVESRNGELCYEQRLDSKAKESRRGDAYDPRAIYR